MDICLLLSETICNCSSRTKEGSQWAIVSTLPKSLSDKALDNRDYQQLEDQRALPARSHPISLGFMRIALLHEVYTSVLARFTTQPSRNNLSVSGVQNQVHGQSKPAFVRHACFHALLLCLGYFTFSYYAILCYVELLLSQFQSERPRDRLWILFWMFLCGKVIQHGISPLPLASFSNKFPGYSSIPLCFFRGESCFMLLFVVSRCQTK